MYTSREEAVDELKRRRTDPYLKQRVEEYLGGNIPNLLRGEDVTTLLFRHIMTPDYEFETFMKYNNELGTRPVLFEYLEDRFVSRNKDKHALAKLSFYINTAPNGEVNTDTLKLIDFSQAENKRLVDIQTTWHEPLASFHHRFLLQSYPQIGSSVCDLSSWVYNFGTHARDYYGKFFTLLVTHTILFDNFRNTDTEASFVQDVAYPAFCEVRDLFQVKPLITPLQPVTDDDDPIWWTYTHEQKTIAEQCARGVC